VRKLLVASQKGGVGKTTTSMNLAAAAAHSGTRVLLLDADPVSNISTALNLADHPHRQSLRQAVIDLPGVLVTNFVPGLDVLSPYEEGRCSDQDLDRLLHALSTSALHDCYGCVIVDVPPFLGAKPEQLLGSCDELLLVMRAETLAYRTLPAFLELVQRSSREGKAISLCGILLTLPEGEKPGCRWERELRGRLGVRILSEVIPYDETIVKALRVGQISSHLHPDSPAARQYRQLVGRLGLAAEPRPDAAAETIIEALRSAATAIGPAAAVPPSPTITELPAETKLDSDPVNLFSSEGDAEPLKPATPPSSRVRRLGRSGEILRHARSERLASAAVAPSSRLTPASTSPDDLEEPTPSPNTDSQASPGTQANGLAQLWPLWILLGAVLGGGLRILSLPPTLLPVLVGLGVALIVVVILRTLAARDDAVRRNSDEGVGDGSWNQEVRAPSRRTDPRRDSGARLVPLGKGVSRGSRRDPHSN
jgi:chromosome partitioning protein